MAAYGQSKFCAERYLGLYDRLYGMSTLALRFGNVYGPRQDPHGEAGVIAIFCGRLRAGARPKICLLYTSPSPRDLSTSRMPSSA